ncbi:MAG: gliding motility-associated C-terminal domain-containing protein [Elusimicrobia bacterium]|nr:gliding motility-associated C-terminal domain-containing protein [Elusimicrobiota bacterium]
MGGVLKAWMVFGALLGGFAAGAGVAAGVRPLGFTFNGVSNRVVTPNGDGRNDNVAFRFSNPRDAAGSVKIYDVRGRLVASLGINPGDAVEVWDARSNGAVVPSGLYIFVISVDGATTSGAVAVIR